MFKRSLIFSFMMVFSPAIFAAPVVTPSQFQVQYDVYAGGMHLLDITQDFSLTSAVYSSTLVAKPSGFFNKIVPWEGRYATSGVVKNGRLLPQRHTKNSRWSDERNETVMQFDKNGDLNRMTDAEWVVGKTKPPVKDMTPDPTLSKHAVDLVTGVLVLLQHAQQTGVQSGEACEASSVIFDGKRRFTMNFTDLGKGTLAKSDYNAFSGVGRHCQIEIKPLAGFNGKKRGFYKIQEDSRIHGGLPSLWMMPAWGLPGDPNAGPPIPVRMLIKSEYGAILVHATKVVRK